MRRGQRSYCIINLTSSADLSMPCYLLQNCHSAAVLVINIDVNSLSDVIMDAKVKKKGRHKR
jgi:hypothetical protein